MDWSIVQELIDVRLFLVVAACWAIGYMLKRTPAIPDWSIVYIVTVLSTALAIGLLGWNVESMIQGLLAGAFAVYGHQLVKQTAQRDTNE